MYVFFGVWEEQAAQRRGWHFLMTFSHHEVFTVQRCTTLVGIGTTRTWLALGLFLGRVGRFLDFEPIDTTFLGIDWIQCHGDCSVVNLVSTEYTEISNFHLSTILIHCACELAKLVHHFPSFSIIFHRFPSFADKGTLFSSMIFGRKRPMRRLRRTEGVKAFTGRACPLFQGLCFRRFVWERNKNLKVKFGEHLRLGNLLSNKSSKIGFSKMFRTQLKTQRVGEIWFWSANAKILPWRIHGTGIFTYILLIFMENVGI